jgi:hypothetical protein
MAVLFGVFLAVHWLIHLLGFAKAFGLAKLPQLTQPIHPAGGVLWLASALLFVSAAIALAAWPRWWWMLAAIAVVVSMIAIVPSWTDARAGAAVNLVATLGVIVGFLVHGPSSLRAAYEAGVEGSLARQPQTSPVAEADLAHLPPPVQRYLRVSGVVGQPRVLNLRARMHGRIRGGPDARWMPFAAEQHNRFDGARTRLFYMTGPWSACRFRDCTSTSAPGHRCW